jgi:hypothetical protein
LRRSNRRSWCRCAQAGRPWSNWEFSATIHSHLLRKQPKTLYWIYGYLSMICYLITKTCSNMIFKDYWNLLNVLESLNVLASVFFCEWFRSNGWKLNLVVSGIQPGMESSTQMTSILKWLKWLGNCSTIDTTVSTKNIE